MYILRHWIFHTICFLYSDSVILSIKLERAATMLKEKHTKKPLYMTPEMDITLFSGENDIVTTSGCEHDVSGCGLYEECTTDTVCNGDRDGDGWLSPGEWTRTVMGRFGLGYHSAALERIRAFRDSSICSTPIGKQLVKEYYRVAPTISQYIEQSGNAKGICDQLWKDHVQAIQQAVRDGRTQDAVQGLVDMNVELCKKYNVEYNETLVEQFRKEGLHG